ncbi:hypothetical protein ALC62_05423, partial [Cyphomyrmex costatus]
RRGRCKDTRFPSVCKREGERGHWDGPIRLGSSSRVARAGDSMPHGSIRSSTIASGLIRATIRRQPVARDRTRFHLEDYGSPGRTGCRRSDTPWDPSSIRSQELINRTSGVFRLPHF